MRRDLTTAVPGVGTRFLPTDEILIDYFDCCGYWIGTRYLPCNGGVTYYGTTTGAHWKHTMVHACDGSSDDDFWQEWNGSSWGAPTSYPVEGNCVC